MTLITQNIIALNLPIAKENRSLDLIKISSGTFQMGYTPDKSLQLSDQNFEVIISKDFWIGKYLITQSQWQSVIEANPSEVRGDDLPVTNISWNEAQLFCSKLNEIHSEFIPDGYQFQLPTEAQWEYTCRAATESKNYGGNEIDDVLKIAWCKENSNRNLQKVGLKKPNLWGLYDMFGNVFEWCFDMIVDYPNSTTIDWVGIDGDEYFGTVGLDRIVRGGCYLTPFQSDCFDAATRNYISPDTEDGCYGFRLCLAPIR